MNGIGVLAVLLWALAAFAQPAGQTPAHRLYEKANALFVAQQFPQSLQMLEEALRLDPMLVPALTLKAKLAMAMDRFDIARETLGRAIRADPSSWYAHFLYGFQFHLQNDLQPALAALEKARQLNPKDGRPVLYLGLTHESLGDTEQALGLYREAIRLEEASGRPQAETLLTCSRLLMLLGRLDESAALIGRALRLEPDSRDARYENARLLLRRGDAAAAAREGEKALRLPAAGIAERQIRYLLVRAYQMSGQEAQAARHAAAVRAADAQGERER